MLLQRQYWILKIFNVFLILIILLIVSISLYFHFRINNIENKMKKEQWAVSSLNSNLNNLKKNENYKKFQIGSYIKENENNTNYYSLYKYLNTIKKNIKKSLVQEGINEQRFELAVSQWRVDISTFVPSYNFLYNKKNWVFELLEKKSFIEKIFINSYKSDNDLIYFDMNLKTK